MTKLIVEVTTMTNSSKYQHIVSILVITPMSITCNERADELTKTDESKIFTESEAALDVTKAYILTALKWWAKTEGNLQWLELSSSILDLGAPSSIKRKKYLFQV